MKGSTKFWISLGVAILLRFYYWVYFQCRDSEVVDVIGVLSISFYIVYELYCILWNTDGRTDKKFKFCVSYFVYKLIVSANKLFDKYLTD